jgi:hypothetical protein
MFEENFIKDSYPELFFQSPQSVPIAIGIAAGYVLAGQG